MSAILEVESRYFQENHQDLALRYPNKFLLVQGEAVCGSFEDEDEAIDMGLESLEGDFLVRHVDFPNDPMVVIPSLLIAAPPDIMAGEQEIDESDT